MENAKQIIQDLIEEAEAYIPAGMSIEQALSHAPKVIAELMSNHSEHPFELLKAAARQSYFNRFGNNDTIRDAFYNLRASSLQSVSQNLSSEENSLAQMNFLELLNEYIYVGMPNSPSGIPNAIDELISDIHTVLITPALHPATIMEITAAAYELIMGMDGREAVESAFQNKYKNIHAVNLLPAYERKAIIQARIGWLPHTQRLRESFDKTDPPSPSEEALINAPDIYKKITEGLVKDYPNVGEFTEKNVKNVMKEVYAERYGKETANRLDTILAQVKIERKNGISAG